MAKSNSKHIASDIRINYDAMKYEEIYELLKEYIELPNLLLLLALIGLKNNRFFELEANDNKNESHDFSRTVYNRNEFTLDSYFGLITILNNIDDMSSNDIDLMAFAKMDTYNKPFGKLPNVRTFYGYLIGGIEPLHSELTKFGTSSEELAKTVYDIVMEKDEMYDLIIEEMTSRYDLGSEETE